MAVTMLIGNRPDIIFSLFAKGNSIPSVIANEFTEATYDLYLSALVELGLVLLLVSVGFSCLGRLLIWRMSRRTGREKNAPSSAAGWRFWKRRPDAANGPKRTAGRIPPGFGSSRAITRGPRSWTA